MVQAPEHFSDIWLFYRSADDPGMWVGHSLLTDQIALGECILEAGVALREVIAALLEEARENPKIRVFHPASKETLARLQKARPLDSRFVEQAEELLARKKRAPQPRGANLSAVVEV